ncbi:MAG: peptidoglycan-binding protein [Acutalibacteraceae bacterium]|nr:peptidoglycan-binding protein [Acutalibacteraceae bacterium]
MPLNPVIPTDITVHLGVPSDISAENITVPFTDYIKNVASSEIYPTWPENSLRANIYAIITFALNRIYTEWYPSQNYDFDITNTTQYDQAYVKDRTVFENISQIVDDIFNSYVARQGDVQPFFTQFCNGTTSTCDGLSQWGTVELARQGRTPYEILQNYYGNDINIIMNAPVSDIESSYPGVPLRQGDSGNDVQIIQTQLNAIAKNYPAIPKIENPDGVFDGRTRDSVEKFQEVFFLEPTGIVDKATWYKIKRYFIGVRRLAELNSIGITVEEANLPYENELSEGDSGESVRAIQYYLSVLAYFNSNLNSLTIDGVFGNETVNAVKVFQQNFGLEPTGIVDRATWNKLNSAYRQLVENLPEGYSGDKATIYPGYVLSIGSRGENVSNLQRYLNRINEVSGGGPQLSVDGIFGNATANAVRNFQRNNNITPSGNVGPQTWQSIARVYDSIIFSE